MFFIILAVTLVIMHLSKEGNMTSFLDNSTRDDKQSLKNQKIGITESLNDCYFRNPESKHKQYKGICWAYALGMSILVGFCAFSLIKSCARRPVPAVLKSHGAEFQQKQMEQYFKKAGSKNPQEMAYAVLKTRNPRLLAAIAKVESGGNPTIRNTGYRKRHSGSFQVNAKHHGAVPHDAIGQALQSERILNELVNEEKSIVRGLNAYGGQRDKNNGQYAFNVLEELTRVP